MTQDENSIQLIFALEQKLGVLIREYKQCKTQLEKIEKKLEQANSRNSKLKQQIESLKEENKAILLKQQSEGLSVHKDLRKYLDEVIELLDKNIDLL